MPLVWWQKRASGVNAGRWEKQVRAVMREEGAARDSEMEGPRLMLVVPAESERAVGGAVARLCSATFSYAV